MIETTIPQRTSIDSGDNNDYISPSELHYTRSDSPPPSAPLRRSSSSPVQSDLPNIYSHLRSNEQEQPVKSNNTRNIFKKLLRLNKSSDSIDETFNNNNSTPTSTSTTNGSIIGLKRGKSIQRSRALQHTGSDLEYIEDHIELQPEISKSIGHIKIAPVFSNDGLPLLKVSHKSKKRILFYIDPTSFKFTWKMDNGTSAPPLAASTNGGSGHRLSISTRNVHEFTLDDIKSIFIKHQGSGYREELHISKEFENKWMTIVYFNQKKGNLKSLHLIADTEHDFKKLNSAIHSLRNLRFQLAKEFLIDTNTLDENYLKMILNKDFEEQKNNKQLREFLSFNDILKYAKRLNINVNQKHLQQIFEEVSKKGDGASFEQGLNFDQFKQFVSILKDRKDIQMIWDKLTSHKSHMDFEDFKKFVKHTQKDKVDDDTLTHIYDKFSNCDDLWTCESLNSFLLSSYSRVYHSFDSPEYYDQPLNDYFISSSHNTYLTGRQVVGDSSVEGYIKALQRGCRCVEIDIWNGSDNSDESNENEPIVNHGRTFTKPISFANVIRAIKKFAFITSPFPLILSLEVHCSPPTQLKVVTILQEILKDNMIMAPINETSTLPSPSQLRHKFIIKVKKTSAFQNLIEMGDGSYTTSTTTTTTTATTTSLSEDNGTGKSSSSTFSIRRKNKIPKVINELSELGIYAQGLKFRNFSLPESKTYNHCFSLGEKSINRMIKEEDKKIALDKHNRRYLMRVYPAGTRLKSTNFNPIPYWAHGVQMVATNWQTYDFGQQLNEAMFDGNDKPGYVLKPSSLRKPILKSSKLLQFMKPKSKKISFSFEIISAQQLPKAKEDDNAINSYITFEIIGAKDIDWDQEINGRTRIVPENGFNPIFNTKFSGDMTVENDLIFVKFVVYASTSVESTPIGIFVARLNYLKQGYRYLLINDLFGEQLVYSSLFVKIKYDEEAMLSL